MLNSRHYHNAHVGLFTEGGGWRRWTYQYFLVLGCYIADWWLLQWEDWKYLLCRTGSDRFTTVLLCKLCHCRKNGLCLVSSTTNNYNHIRGASERYLSTSSLCCLFWLFILEQEWQCCHLLCSCCLSLLILKLALVHFQYLHQDSVGYGAHSYFFWVDNNKS